MVTATIAATMAGAKSALANFGMFPGPRDDNGRTNPLASILVALLAPMAGMLIWMAIPRAREFEADRGGAEISGDPKALADALQKIEAFAFGIPMASADLYPETAQMMIMSPLSAEGFSGLFLTHPATEVRVARPRYMA